VRFEGRKRNLGILAVVAGVAVAVACGGSGYSSSPSPMPTPTPAPTGGGGGSADVTITINGESGGMSFSPASAAVKVGQTVAWRNADSITHTATGTSFDTGAIGAGRTSAPITVTAAGNVGYHCTIHPSMVGTLNVTQ
jgi:plastocyanin